MSFDHINSTPYNWSFSQKVFFRFFFLFFGLLIIPFPLGIIPFVKVVAELYSDVWESLVVWFGKNVLQLGYEINTAPTGSSDTTYKYVRSLIMLLVAVFGSLIWSVLDRKNKHHEKLLFWFLIILRYYLAYNLLVYGLGKVFKLQFPGLYLSRLLQPYGESSPMGFAWTFFGYSNAYNIYIGSAEALAGLLLFFRRTTTLGALLSICVISNIVMLNFCYDIPVKLWSSQLLLMAFFLIAIDFRRINNFILNKPVPPSEFMHPYQSKKWKTGMLIIKILLIGYILITEVYSGIERKKQWGDDAPKPALYGIYEVATFVRNNDTILPLITDSNRWRRLIIQWEGYATVKLMNDSVKVYEFNPDTINKTVTINPMRDTINKSLMRYEQPEKDKLILKGKLMNDSLIIDMNRFDETKFPLINRGFHWITEKPYHK